jgi:putative effector of murein hydrolase
MIEAQMKETVEASLLNFISMNMLLWLLLTIAVYSCAIKIYAFTKRYKWLNPILHPIIVCTVIIIVCINVASSSVIDYQQNTHLLSALLGPATVALAIPLYHQLTILLKTNWRVLVPICVAAILSPALSWISLYFLDVPLDLQLTMLVKSITTPLAIDTAQAIGGIGALSAVFVISTGIVGAVCGPSIFTLLKVQHHAAQGVAMGSVAHVIGTARTVSISEQCTAFATLALCVNGIVTSLLLPILFA